MFKMIYKDILQKRSKY